MVETAKILLTRHGSAAKRFWQARCWRLYTRLQHHGVPEEDARLELDHFTCAVQRQMEQAEAGWSNDPRGAA